MTALAAARYSAGHAQPFVESLGPGAPLPRDMTARRDAGPTLATDLQESSLLQLAIVAEARDGSTACHMIRVGQIAGLLTLAITGDSALAALVTRAAPMHDIGKIAIADSVLKKEGPLLSGEMDHMRSHARIGAELLRSIGGELCDLAADIAMAHHERFDGSGYPGRTRGSQIPLVARITSVADFYDALVSDRCYRPALPHAEVLGMLKAESGRAFDPEVVDTALAMHDEIHQLGVLVNLRFAGVPISSLTVGAFDPMFLG